MFNSYLKNINPEIQGTFAFILGIILILGTLGKLGILQGILDTIMILMAITLIMWGLHISKGYSKIKNYINTKK